MSKIGIKHPIFDDIALYFICEATLFKQNNQNRVFYTYPEMSRILIYQQTQCPRMQNKPPKTTLFGMFLWKSWTETYYTSPVLTLHTLSRGLWTHYQEDILRYYKTTIYHSRIRIDKFLKTMSKNVEHPLKNDTIQGFL